MHEHSIIEPDHRFFNPFKTVAPQQYSVITASYINTDVGIVYNVMVNNYIIHGSPIPCSPIKEHFGLNPCIVVQHIAAENCAAGTFPNRTQMRVKGRYGTPWATPTATHQYLIFDVLMVPAWEFLMPHIFNTSGTSDFVPCQNPFYSHTVPLDS